MMFNVKRSLIVQFLLLLYNASLSNMLTLLYNTENSPSAQYYDCIYYTNENNSIQGVKYCIQMNISTKIERNFTQHENCSNRGKLLSFFQLKMMNISPDNVLKWSTSIEQADKYAKYFTQNISVRADDDFYLCNCTRPGVFGKYCEYEFYLDRLTFSQAIEKQFEIIEKYQSGSQYHNNRPCYSAHFECDFGLMCLDWRNICDGKQQCMDGVDENYCEKLEFNECEDGEYRCVNGMCIPEEYWLDGEYDCMDWSDEMLISVETGIDCIHSPNLDCDEHLCLYDQYSCGDGQCYRQETNRISNELFGQPTYCLNYRDINYLCEIIGRFRNQPWTIDGGYCMHDRLPYTTSGYDTTASKDECAFLVKCAFSKNLDTNCNCDDNCADQIQAVCPPEIQYPVEGNLITPYFIMKYRRDDYDWTAEISRKYYVRGSIQCRGYQIMAKKEAPIHLIFEGTLLQFGVIEQQFCALRTQFEDDILITFRNQSGPQFPVNCWNESKTFNNMTYQYRAVCEHRCFSKYRLRDGIYDCSLLLEEDEKSFINQSCPMQQKYRLQCSATQLSCLLAAKIGTFEKECPNGIDEFSYVTGIDLSTMEECRKRNDAACLFFRTYIQQSSSLSRNVSFDNSTQSIKSLTSIPFSYYCDSFFDTESALDELFDLCRDWVCHRQEYKCLTGQCIPQNFVSDGQWDCADASDEERLFLMSEYDYDEHNRFLMSLSKAKKACYDVHNLDNTPFSDLCDIEKQYPCFRVQDLKNPFLFNVTMVRPCIDLNKIGDGMIDCIGGLDERNTLRCPNEGMLGFNFLKSNGKCIPYLNLCDTWMPNTSIEHDTVCGYRELYFNHDKCTGKKDFACLNGMCIPNGRCDGKVNCEHGEDEYWCNVKEPFSQMIYRDRALMQISTKTLLLPTYPRNDNSNDNLQTQKISIAMSKSSNTFLKRHKTTGSRLRPSIYTFMDSSLPEDWIVFEEDYLPFICNRGLAVMDEKEETKCFCPPSFYGNQCELYSDRITVETHLDLQHYNKRHDSSIILKVLTTFLFQNLIIDYYVFHVHPSLQTEENFVKQKIYFLYPRTEEFLLLKKMNRSGTQLYSVRFEVFELSDSERIKLIGVWHYPIYFDFLPAYRLAKILRFSEYVSTRNDFHSKHPCGANGTYYPINNKNDSYFCSCRSGSHGKHCEHFDDNSTSYCLSNSISKPEYHNFITRSQKPLCLCPANSFGPTCHLKNTACSSNPCRNSGSCYVSYDFQNIQSYFCVCTNLFYGDRCDMPKALVHIKLNTTLMTAKILGFTVQFYDIANKETLNLITRHQVVYDGTSSAVRLYHDQSTAPLLGVMKLYETTSESQIPAYFILYIQENVTSINITSELSSENRCPNIRTLWHLVANGSKNTTFNSTTAVFKYHQICRAKNQTTTSPLTCFHDDNYLCICEEDFYRVECFNYDPASDRCSLCLSNGYCLKGDLTTNKFDFLCLCPRCHHGKLCQFSTELMSFTLDSLMVKDIQTNWKLSVGLYASIILLIFLFVLFNNFCSILTFIRPNARKSSVGYYLLLVSIINKLSFLFLLAKVIHIVLGSSGILFYYNILNLFSCKIISYLLSVFTRINYWLTSLVTIVRLCIVLFPTSQIFKKPRIAFGLSLFVMLMVAGMHIHEALYYITTTDPSYTTVNITLCVTNYVNQQVSFYNRINVLIHYFVPFLIQVFSITILIIQTTRSRDHTASGKQTFMIIFKKEFNAQKEQYITPIIIILSALPQAILSFTYACTELKQAWQRYILLTTYFLSYLPQMLGFILYVLPSTTYKTEFQQTFIGKRLIKKTK